MALAYQLTGQVQKAQSAIATLHAGQDVAGGLFTSDRPELTTGFILPDGHPWLYYRRLHPTNHYSLLPKFAIPG